jgi:hypothetical protein
VLSVFLNRTVFGFMVLVVNHGSNVGSRQGHSVPFQKKPLGFAFKKTRHGSKKTVAKDGIKISKGTVRTYKSDLSK